MSGWSASRNVGSIFSRHASSCCTSSRCASSRPPSGAVCGRAAALPPLPTCPAVGGGNPAGTTVSDSVGHERGRANRADGIEFGPPTPVNRRRLPWLLQSSRQGAHPLRHQSGFRYAFDQLVKQPMKLRKNRVEMMQQKEGPFSPEARTALAGLAWDSFTRPVGPAVRGRGCAAARPGWWPALRCAMCPRPARADTAGCRGVGCSARAAGLSVGSGAAARARLTAAAGLNASTTCGVGWGGEPTVSHCVRMHLPWLEGFHWGAGQRI